MSTSDKLILGDQLVWFQNNFSKRLQGIKPGVLKRLSEKGVTIHNIDLNAFKNSVKKAKVAQKVSKAGKWRSNTLDRFRSVLTNAGFEVNFWNIVKLLTLIVDDLQTDFYEKQV